MATREQIFDILCGASGPMSRVELAEKVGEDYQRFQTQLKRWVEQGLIEDTGEHNYVMTEKGREEALRAGEFQELATTQLVPPEHTEESLGTTEYQQFIRFGMHTGVTPLGLIQQTAQHVWDGGQYADLKWVAQAMVEMGIRQDLRGRWFHRWRSYLKAGIPTDLPSEFLPTGTKTADEKRESEKKEGAGKKDYILNEDNMPINVGEGLGDLDYKDALDLAKVREARGRSDGRPNSPGSMAEEVTKIFGAFKEVMGEKAEGKSYVIKPGEEGYQVEEVDGSKPIVVPQSQPNKPGPSFFIDSDGAVKELQPGQPVVIVKEPPKPTNQGNQYLIDQRTGEVKEVAPGQPIVIIRDNAPQSQMTPIQVTDKDGKPLILDLSTYIKLEEHKDRQRRDEESHQTKMEIGKQFKDMLKKAGTALGNVIEGKEE